MLYLHESIPCATAAKLCSADEGVFNSFTMNVRLAQDLFTIFSLHLSTACLTHHNCIPIIILELSIPVYMDDGMR